MKKKKKFVSNIDLINDKLNHFTDLEKISNKYYPYNEKSHSHGLILNIIHFLMIIFII